MAESAREAYHLERVIFIPAYIPPHKQETIVSAEHRYEMVRLAIASNPYFTISDIEIQRKGNSYTIDTIKAVRNIYGEDVKLFFLAGTDTIHQLSTWKNIYELLQICEFIGATRPDGTESIQEVQAYFGDIGKKNIHRLKVPELEISSTDIRARILAKKSVKYMLPDEVISYIETNNIYSTRGEAL